MTAGWQIQQRRLTDAMGACGCDAGRKAQKSDHIYGRMAQLVVPTGYFVEISHGRMAQLVEPTGQVIKLPVHEYLK